MALTLILFITVPSLVGWMVIIVAGLRWLSTSNNRVSALKGQARLFLLLHEKMMEGEQRREAYYRHHHLNLKLFYWKVPHWILRNMAYHHHHRLNHEHNKLRRIGEGLSEIGGYGIKCGQHPKSNRVPKLYSLASSAKDRFRSLEPDISVQRLDYYDFDLSRYGSTPQHFYKEKKPIIFKFIPRD